MRGLPAATDEARWMRFTRLASVCLLALALAAGLASCGGESPPREARAEGGEGETRLPPGLSSEDLEGLDLGGTPAAPRAAGARRGRKAGKPSIRRAPPTFPAPVSPWSR